MHRCHCQLVLLLLPPQGCMMVEEGAVPLLVNMMQVGCVQLAVVCNLQLFCNLQSFATGSKWDWSHVGWALRHAKLSKICTSWLRVMRDDLGSSQWQSHPTCSDQCCLLFPSASADFGARWAGGRCGSGVQPGLHPLAPAAHPGGQCTEVVLLPLRPRGRDISQPASQACRTNVPEASGQ